MNNMMYKQSIYLAKPDNYSNKNYKDFYEKALPILQEYCDVVSVKVSDVWIRDFFPIQNPHTKELFRFNYDPLYDRKNSRSVYKLCREDTERLFKGSKDLPVWMDGGNLILDNEYGFTLVSEGTDIDKHCKLLGNELGIEVVPLPYIHKVPEEDSFGHIDGALQILGENTILFSEPLDKKEQRQIKAWQDIITKRTNGKYKYNFLPNSWDEKNLRSDIDAKGIYVNYLETTAAVFVPQYNLPSDEEAMAVIRKYTDKKVVGIDCDKISIHGGSLHCLTKEIMERDMYLREYKYTADINGRNHLIKNLNAWIKDIFYYHNEEKKKEECKINRKWEDINKFNKNILFEKIYNSEEKRLFWDSNEFYEWVREIPKDENDNRKIAACSYCKRSPVELEIFYDHVESGRYTRGRNFEIDRRHGRMKAFFTHVKKEGFCNFEEFVKWAKNEIEKIGKEEQDSDMLELFHDLKKALDKEDKDFLYLPAPYCAENCVVACYWCNNAKTDAFTDEEFGQIGTTIGAKIEEIVKKVREKNK